MHEPNTLWMREPASRWLDAFPIGNGRLGGMVFGTAPTERIALNHEDLWRGVTRLRTTEPKHQYLPEIREKLFAGLWVEAAALATRHLSGHQLRTQPYQPAGDLTLAFPGHESPAVYRRSLHLATGMVEIAYESGGVVYRREVFASAVHGAIVLRLTADRPGALNVIARLNRAHDPACSIRLWSTGDRLGLEGRFDEGITFAAQARIRLSNGSAVPGKDGSLQVSGADELILVLAMAVDYDHPDPAAWCSNHLDAIPADYPALLEAHSTEHGALFERVDLDLASDPELESMPTDRRVGRLRDGEDDPGLLALYFQYGRYLLMSSSRSCNQPANLQGIWNEELRPSWDSDFHHNVNLQMCYWPAEVCNLAECAEPLFNYLWRAVPEGQKAARDLYGCRGICLPLQTDLWDRATPEGPGWDVWTGAAAWLAGHLWWRWEYDLDRDFLRQKVYPFLKMAADFYEDYLVRGPSGHLVTAPSQSPENRFVGGAQPVSICISATMDILLIHEVLSHCLEASVILGCDEELRPKWQDTLEALPPFRTGRHGQLQEWLEDFEEVEPAHRHMSHLFGVYPGEQMTPEASPDLFRAARVSLDRRVQAGGGYTGWSRAWVAALAARFRDGALAHEHMKHLIADFTTASLLDLHPPQIFQIDGNFGGTAAVAEMLLQSHGGIIRPLPALPPQWPNGRVKGLRARGGFTVDIEWRDGVILDMRILSERGQDCRIAWPPERFHVTAEGQPLAVERDASGLIPLGKHRHCVVSSRACPPRP